MDYTTHAKTRMAQRAISSEHVDIVLQYGEEYYHGHGEYYSCLSAASLKRLQMLVTAKRLSVDLSKIRKMFVVSTDEAVITAGLRQSISTITNRVYIDGQFKAKSNGFPLV